MIFKSPRKKIFLLFGNHFKILAKIFGKNLVIFKIKNIHNWMFAKTTNDNIAFLEFIISTKLSSNWLALSILTSSYMWLIGQLIKIIKKIRKYISVKILRSINFRIFHSYLYCSCPIWASNPNSAYYLLILQTNTIQIKNCQPCNSHTSFLFKENPVIKFAMLT